ncbi:acyltransferase family protein [Bowmanella pacifica]|uniref:Membrane protein n=1 Tax=Bowmanella pacifica TaxID=502051 RepID=A0A917YXU5_9ALTE|nr:heparan-alpha-glucosaminide N-acetyltransferase domain-containing protein [Bowmanella pacifica]GGO69722.1 membrane protein [Bowmanella pacifica]
MKRELSLDIFRGLTLAAMILVNTPGSWSHVYAPLLHASWHGLTPTDLIFPFFLFIVGAAMFHSMGRIPKGQIPWAKVIKRTLLMFLIGFALNIYPFTGDPENWRIMGVLQRIALCYFVGALLILSLNTRGVWLASAGILVGYWLLMQMSADPWSLEHNLVRQVDVTLLGAAHLYQGFGVAFDPEGLLSCLPATVTLLAGYLTSSMLSGCTDHQTKIKNLLTWAAIALLAGLLWHPLQPINKALWTGSYVLVTSAFAWLTLALIIYCHDIRQWQKGFHWAQVYGSNPLFIYVLSWLYAATLGQVIRFDVDGKSISAYQWTFEFLSDFMSQKNASLLFALIAVGLHYLLSAWLYKRKIFIKL